MFAQAFGTGGAADVGRSGFTPFAELCETETSYVLTVDLPGIDLDDVDVAFQGRRTVVVEGERQESTVSGRTHWRTRRIGRFHLTAYLPGDTDPDSVSIAVGRGELVVRVAKA